MVQEGYDYYVVEVVVMVCIVQGSGDVGEYGSDGNVVFGVGLWIEEDFGMVYVVGLCVGNVGGGYVVEVLFGVQYVGVGVVEIEEGLQVVEVVGCVQVFD